MGDATNQHPSPGATPGPAPRGRRGRARTATTDAPEAPLADRGGVQLIRDAAGLAGIARHIRERGAVALDTEFIPENRFFPELCLVQLATDEVEAVVDPLAIKDLQPIFDLVAAPAVLKVVHSGKHDFDIFHSLAGVVPKNVFDTQVAAAVIGHGKRVQIALSALVSGFVGRELSKNEQMSNWLHRPLSARQVEYAIADVRYLLRLREKLTGRARSLSRMDWLEQEMEPLTDPASYGLPPEDEYYRNLDAVGLTESQRGSLRALAGWRERRARSGNRPRTWVLRDGVLRDLARRQPQTLEAMLQPYREGGRRPGKVEPKTAQHARTVIGKHHAALLEQLRRGAAHPIPFTGVGKAERRAAPESVALLLETWLKLRASEHGVAPELLATAEELRVIASTYPNPPKSIRPLRGFRRQVLGDDLLLILSGEAVIQVEANPKETGALPPIRLSRPGRLGRFFLRDRRAAPVS